MKLTLLKSGLPFVLAATLVSGQQGKPASTPPQPHTNAAKQSAEGAAQTKAQHETKVHRSQRKRNARTARRNGAKRAAYRPEYAEQHVEVINGASTNQVVFHDEKKPGEDGKVEPPEMKVEVVNGTASDTQYFSAAIGQADPGVKRNQPVVLGIQSSDTRFAGANKHPVVTGIAAVSPGDAKSPNSGGQKATTGVAPKPKRPEYQPETQ